MGIIGLILALLLFGITLSLSIFSWKMAAIAYVAGIYIVTVVIVISIASMRPDTTMNEVWARKVLLSDEEERLFRKYYAFFVYPFGTQNFAHFVNYARILGVFWIAINLWQKLYFLAFANVFYFLISAPIMWRLSPIAHYKAAAEKGAVFAIRELQMMQHIMDLRDELGF